MSKVLNFDQFMSEKTKDNICVTIYGKNYDVPMEIPAIVPVMMARAESALDPQQSTKMIMRAADAMLGSDAVDELCTKGMSAKNLSALVQQLFQQINGNAEEDDDAEEVSDEDSRKQTGEGKRAKK